MALSDSEIESLRQHLGYGNIGVGGYPYTPDGFKQLFDDVIAPNLTGDTETTATVSVTAGANATITPVSMTGIVRWAKLVVDAGDDAETVTVRSVAASTFVARFAKAHTGTCPIMLSGGHSSLRLLLHSADLAKDALTSSDVGATAGLKSLDKEDVVWFEGGEVLKGKLEHYRAIIGQISQLVRVTPAWATGGGGSQLEAY